MADDNSDSEAEGQLLIDESVDVSKKRKGRKKGSLNKKTEKKALKLIVKPPTVSKDSEQNEAKNAPTATRASTRLKKRVRKLSPSPEIVKKEPPKKKLKVKIKNLSKEKKNSKVAKLKSIDTGANTKKTITPIPEDNVDIENVSDEELNEIHYSSIIVSDRSSEKPKKTKHKKKSGIKLKLSLGKVLSSNAADSIITEDDDLLDNKITLKDNVVKPLIISKRRVSSDNSLNEEISSSNQRISITSSGGESPYYSSSSEDHKPLTLRLSMGKPKVINRSISEFKNSQTSPQVFPNIQRSWSVTPLKDNDAITDSTSPQSPKHDKITSKIEVPSPTKNLSTTPFFSAGLQSLLDVVSVEINEQNKTEYDSENITDQGSDVKTNINLSTLSHAGSYLNSNKLQSPEISTQRLGASHDGHLPSLAFPKPVLPFASKKRSRSKSLNKISPHRPLENSLIEIKPPLVEEIEDYTPQILTEKERRRRDKKKTLNSDFVDPDTVLTGPEEPKPKKRPVVISSIQDKTGGGFSLLMPQMTKNQSIAEPKLLQMGSTTQLPNKNVISKKPRKGMATAKQRLANKLKIGRTCAF